MKTITSNFELDRIPTSSKWPSFEVLFNPRRLNLGTGHVALRQKGQCSKHNGLISARPVLAESPSSQSLTRKRRYLPSSYLAFCEKLRDTHNHHSYQPGVVQEVTENGKLAFFHGLYNINTDKVCYLSAVAVFNTRLPWPPPIDNYRRFYKL